MKFREVYMSNFERAKTIVDRRDYPKSEKEWEELKELADAGYMLAQQYLGDLYSLEKKGNTHKDYEDAIRYYKMAIQNQGDALWCAKNINEAREKQLTLYGENRGRAVTIQENDDAFQYLLYAANCGDINAKCRVIEGYAAGEFEARNLLNSSYVPVYHIKRDENTAIEMFQTIKEAVEGKDVYYWAYQVAKDAINKHTRYNTNSIFRIASIGTSLKVISVIVIINLLLLWITSTFLF